MFWKKGEQGFFMKSEEDNTDWRNDGKITVDEIIENNRRLNKRFRQGFLTGAVVALVVTVVFSGVFSVLGGSLEYKMNVLEDLVNEKYLFEERIDTSAADDASLKGYIESLGDPYSRYLTSDEMEKYMENLQGDICGVGVNITNIMENDIIYTVVVDTIEGYSAEKEGVKSGDKIIEVDGTDVTGMTASQVSSMMTGDEGTTINVSVQREGTVLDFVLERAVIHVDSVKESILEDGIGYIQVSAFNSDTGAEFIEAVENLEKNGMKGLVIDLRNNGGGLVSACIQMLDRLLPEGVLVNVVDKYGNEQSEKSDSRQLDIPISIIVNENSASASEIFVGAMQDYKRAVIVGTKTYGKGIIQEMHPLDDGSGLVLTVAEYTTPGGRHIHEKGIEPDVYVEDSRTDLFDSEDAQKDAAISEVKQKLQ